MPYFPLRAASSPQFPQIQNPPGDRVTKPKIVRHIQDDDANQETLEANETDGGIAGKAN